MQGVTKNRGFTLLELVMVVAILALLSTLAVGVYSSVQKTSAEKVSISNEASVYRAVTTFMALSGGRGPDKLDALIDFGTAADTGQAGKFVGLPSTFDVAGTGSTTMNSATAVGGVYRGVKAADATGTAATADMLSKNHGLVSDLYGKVCVYYLGGGMNDVSYLNQLGLTTVLQHNYTSGQATALGVTTVGGGPGFRVESTACVPVTLAKGTPVLAVDPLKGSQIYAAFGMNLANYNTANPGVTPTTDADALAAVKAAGGYLLLFGLGGNSTIIGNKNGGIADAPRSEILDYTYYRQYFLVYRIPTTPNQLCADFLGVIDPRGQSIKDARFANDWRNGDR
jgi:prepilin-type N-terminal cleavage/methylation domain-containing protein